MSEENGGFIDSGRRNENEWIRPFGGSVLLGRSIQFYLFISIY